MDELVKLARRFLFVVSLRDEFSMHVEAVNRVDTRNEVSEAMEKHLDRKYQACLSRFERARTDADVLALWQEHCARGEVAGALWTTLTHKAVSDETRHVVYTDVHMLSRLPDMINSADAVICPTVYVSHSAYYQLKRHCKRAGKPWVLFKGASISGLARLSSGRVSLSGETIESLRAMTEK